MKQRNAALLITALLASQISAQSGTLDPTYGNGGISILQPGDLHDVAHDIVVLGDNTSLICGVARVDGRNSIFVAHLYNDGSLDASWGTSGGYTFFTIGDEAYGYAMGVDSQGRIYVTGIAYPTLAQAVVPLVRADASGQPDLTFGTNGVMLYPLSDTEAEARDLVVLGDDRVLLAGSAIGPDFDRDSFIMRLLEDGSPDPSFGNGGTAINDHVGDDQLNCLALMDNGNAVGAGHANVSFVMKTVLFMVDGTGTPENGFGNAGTLLPEIGSNDHAAWGMVASGTRMFVTGWLGVAAGIDAYVACIRSDGNFHPPFGGGDGIVTIDANPVDNGYDIARYSNNDLIVCGTSGESGFGVPRDFMLARLTDSGDQVMSFGLNGVTTTSIQQDFDDANAVAIELDGKILLAGFTSGFSTFTDNDVAVCRYDVDWTLGTVTAPVLELGAFPNPANDNQITITHEGGANARALLRDAAGRVARDFGVVPAGSSQLSVAGLADGRYLLELRAPDRVAQHAVVIAR